MKAIVCEMCGSQDLIKQDGYYVCQNCGTKYDPEEAKKLMVEVSGTVKVDDSDKMNNLLQLAERAYKEGNYQDAENYYKQVSLIDPSSWESHFYTMMSAQRQRTIVETPQICEAILSNIGTTLSLIKNDKRVFEGQENWEQLFYSTIFLDIFGFLRTIFSTDITVLAKTQGDTYFYGDFKKHTRALCSTSLVLCSLWRKIEDEMDSDKESDNDNSDVMAVVYNDCLSMNNFTRKGFQRCVGFDVLSDDEKDVIRNAIAELDPSLEVEKEPPISKRDSGGCYVATAVYGSYDCPQVWTLRRYRDYTLAETWYGRAFIRTYYAISPTLVKWFGETEWFKSMWKPKLDKMVKELNEMGVYDTPYQDRDW